MINGPKASATDVFTLRNIRLFMMFRVLFNSRFYYPVFTVLFLDFGLSVAEFSILNAVWAATIVLAEVPSGALADIVGRKALLVSAASLMVMELTLITVVPLGNPSLVFGAFLVNRILSGLAEAAASGADEALAYDTLQERGMGDQWGKVLERLMRYQSFGFVIAMSVGAAVYDPELVNRVFGWFGIHLGLDQSATLRIPLLLTLGLSFGALAATIRMKETGAVTHDETDNILVVDRVTRAFALTLEAGGWILKTPFVIAVIGFGMLFDGTIRMVITLSSQYYRVIQIPEALFGIIGSTVALLGLFVPRIARLVAEKQPASHAVWVTAGLALTGLAGMAFFWPIWGLLPALVTFAAMYFNGFFVSFYVNRATDSDQRATVLSFKGLLYNVSYGVLGVLYASLLDYGKAALDAGNDLSVGLLTENNIFMETFVWFPVFFVLGLGVMVVVYLRWLRT